MDALFDSFYQRSLYLGSNIQMTPIKVTSTILGAQKAIELLATFRSFDSSILDIYACYNSGSIYCADGITKESVFFRSHLNLCKTSINIANEITHSPQKRLSILQNPSGKGVFLFHFPIQIAGQKPTVSINFVVNDAKLTTLINELLVIKQTVFYAEASDNTSISYGTPQGVKNLAEHSSSRKNDTITLMNTLSDSGLLMRVTFEKRYLFADSVLLSRAIWGISIIMSAIGFWLCYAIAVKHNRQFEPLNQLACSIAQIQNEELLPNDLQNIRMQMSKLYSSHIDLLKVNQAMRYIQRQQAATLIFHGILSSEKEIEQCLLNINLELSEPYFCLFALYVKPSFEKTMDAHLKDALYEKNEHSYGTRYVVLYELPNNDYSQKIRKAFCQQKIIFGQDNVLIVQYTNLYENVEDISHAYRTLTIRNDSIDSGIVDNNAILQDTWERIFLLLSEYTIFVQDGDISNSLKAIQSLYSNVENQPEEMQRTVQQELLMRTNYYLMQNEEDLPRRDEVLALVSQAANDEHEFWNLLAQALCLCNFEPTKKDFSEKATSYIINNFNRADLTMEEVAEKCQLEKHYFSRKFRNEVGEKYIDFLSRIRMEEAQRLAKTTDMKTMDIALAVGYLDVASFRRKFSLYYGYSIAEYRSAVKKL